MFTFPILKIDKLYSAQVKRNKEFIATNIQEIFNPFQVAQVSQPIDLQKLFMHQLQQQNVPAPQMLPQPVEAPAIVNGTIANPLLNGCTTLVTNTNINVTYLNGSINGAKQYEAEKFKMHQGFIAVLKVKDLRRLFHNFNNSPTFRKTLASSRHSNMIRKSSSTSATSSATRTTWNWARKSNTH